MTYTPEQIEAAAHVLEPYLESPRAGAALEIAAAVLAAAEQEAWQPIETQPEEGNYLVYMPGARVQKIQACRAAKGGDGKAIRTIGSLFSFDMPPTTHWRPHPPPPGDGA